MERKTIDKTLTMADARRLIAAIDAEEQETSRLVNEIMRARENHFKLQEVHGLDKMEAINLSMRETAAIVNRWDLPGFQRLLDLIVLDGYRIEKPDLEEENGDLYDAHECEEEIDALELLRQQEKERFKRVGCDFIFPDDPIYKGRDPFGEGDE